MMHLHFPNIVHLNVPLSPIRTASSVGEDCGGIQWAPLKSLQRATEKVGAFMSGEGGYGSLCLLMGGERHAVVFCVRISSATGSDVRLYVFAFVCARSSAGDA